MDLTVNILEENKLENPFLAEVKKGFDFQADNDFCIFKTCCKKYKKGKRCKKCPGR